MSRLAPVGRVATASRAALSSSVKRRVVVRLHGSRSRTLSRFLWRRGGAASVETLTVALCSGLVQAGVPSLQFAPPTAIVYVPGKSRIERRISACPAGRSFMAAMK